MKDVTHLLIDGYNIIHARKELKRIFEYSVNSACDHLSNWVRVIHDQETLRLTIVFDGQGSEVEIDRPGNEMTFSYIYTPKHLSADAVIEQIVFNSRRRGILMVATQDIALRNMVYALGASVMNLKDLETWVNRCEESQRCDLDMRKKRVEREWKMNDPWGKL